MARLTLILGVLAMVIYLLDGFRFVVNEWRHWRNKGTWLMVMTLCLLPTTVFAEDLYVGQADAGAADGSSCANQHDRAWFNTAGNWGVGAGKVSAGDTVHLCGTITNYLQVQASGSVGSPITIMFEVGSKISMANCTAGFGCFYTSGRTYIIVDGGSNGIIEATDNGTVLGTRLASIGIYMDPCSNCEIKNLTVQNMYVHTADLTDSTVDYALVNAILLSGSNTTIHHNTIHDAGWAIYQLYGNGDTTTEIHHNEIYNSSHGWTVAGSGAISASNFKFYNNHVYDYSNWDTTANAYHHDGVFAFGIGGAVGDQYDIYNNFFEGACGNNMTGHLFFASNFSGDSWTATGTARIFNNVFLCLTHTVNGIVRPDQGGVSVYNNTIIGNGNANSICVTFASLAVVLFKNNAMSGCGTNISLGSSATAANHATDVNYNTYVCGGSSTCFNWTGTQAFTGAIATWRAGCGCDANSSDNASLLVDGAGAPQGGSPMINTGTDLSGLGIASLNADYYGNARPAGVSWDTGAIEYGAGTGVSSPVVIARVLRWMEVLLPIVGVGWHCRRWIASVAMAGVSFCSVATFVTYDKVKIVSYTTALKVTQAVVVLTKRNF